MSHRSSEERPLWISDEIFNTSDALPVNLQCQCVAGRNLQGSHASWKVLDFFFLENSRTWKVLENHFGPGKSWKLKLKVLESPEKISLKVMHFSSGLNGKQAAVV